MFRAKLKDEAKASLSGNWGIAILALLLSEVILGASGAVFVGPLILAGPMAVGLATVFLCLVRREGPATIEMLFTGFHDFVTTFLAGLLVALYCFLWGLLFVVPGIVKGLGYAQTYYLICDNPGMPAKEAMRRSEEMMRGHKGEFFVLQLSFLGWWLLTAITFGLVGFYTSPYYNTTMAEYYTYLRFNEQAGPQEDTAWSESEGTTWSAPEGAAPSDASQDHDPSENAPDASEHKPEASAQPDSETGVWDTADHAGPEL